MSDLTWFFVAMVYVLSVFFHATYYAIERPEHIFRSFVWPIYWFIYIYEKIIRGR